MPELIDSKEFVRRWKELQSKRKSDPERYLPRSTGIRALDKILGGGVEFGSVVIYGGAQKVGKSTLLGHTAKTFGVLGEPFAYFSIEMTNEAMATRLFCDMSGVEKDRVRRIEWTEAEWERLCGSADIVGDFDARWGYGIASIAGIKSALIQANKELPPDRKIRTIFVDYIQLMSHPHKSMRREELSAISRAFKRMSIEMEEPMLVFLAAQVNREAAKNHIISANTFLGTGDIERDMDIGIIIHTIKHDDGTILPDRRQLTVVGSRETGVGSVEVRFNGTTSSIRDMEDKGDEITKDFWEQQTRQLQPTPDF